MTQQIDPVTVAIAIAGAAVSPELAELVEIEAYAGMTERSIAACEAELQTLNDCIAALEPMRRYSHLPDPQAHEAAQSDEWLRELMYRAENMLITTGSIAADHFATMRQHPGFAAHLLPHIRTVSDQLAAGKRDALLMQIATRRPALLDVLPERLRLGAG